jgi:hypothetical protein
LGIPIFWKYPRILASRFVVRNSFKRTRVPQASGSSIKHGQTLLQLLLFGLDPGRQNATDLFVEHPKIVKGHDL